ncbi:MAG: hypothetical protein HYU77_05655 [Betaproteobacteria bacterium]|nr:hypothetical protein [Betaproteobacteria bacterium]
METYLIIIELFAGIGLFGVALSWYCGSRRSDEPGPGAGRPVAVSGAPAGNTETTAARTSHTCANSICRAPLAGPDDGQAFLAPAPGYGLPRRVMLCARCAELVVSRAHLRTQLEGIRLGSR